MHDHNSPEFRGAVACVEIDRVAHLGELGGLRPGDLVKLGAVVGGSALDEAAQIRWIDTRVLGYSLAGSERQKVLLEGLCVQLALPPSLDSNDDGLRDWQEQFAGTDPHENGKIPFDRVRVETIVN